MTNSATVQRVWSRGRRRLTPWAAAIAARVRPLGPAKPHGLPAPLIISLTSYPPRYPTLHLTLRCLLSQSTAADKVILWVAAADREALPPSVLALTRHGLEIAVCEDLKSFGKIIPSLAHYPEAFIVTADDDVHYSADWLERLIAAWSANGSQIVCHRAHEPRYEPDGSLGPYKSWRYDVADCVTDSRRLFPTGVGGVLYAPGSLPAETLNRRVFKDLCPAADDVWLYFMGMLNGVVYSRTPGRTRLVSWPGTQDVGLFRSNDHLDMNDVQIARMEQRYGRLS